MPDTPVNSQAPNRNKLRNDGRSIQLKYPSDLVENYPHSVDFTIYIPQKSNFKKTVRTLQTGGVSNYDGIKGMSTAAGLAKGFYSLQAGFEVAKDAALGGATAASMVPSGGRNIATQLVSGAGKLLAAGAGAAAGAAASFFTNSRTQTAAKSAIASALVEKQTEVTGLQLNRTAQRIDKMISLYMPANFFTTYGHDYDQISVKEAGGMAGMLGGAGSLVDTSKISSVEGFKDALSKLPGSSNPYVALATGSLASSTSTPIIGGNLVGSGYTDVALFNMGYAQNPMLEVLYRGTNFRTFQFEFMFQPKSQKEAFEALEIIKTFKFHAAPETNPMADPSDGISKAGSTMPMFFVPPSEFSISLRHGNLRNPHLPTIGRCVLNRIDVDYSPGGQWQTYADGVPIEVRLRLEFTEIELVTKQKINSDDY